MALTGFNNPNLAAGATNELTQSEEARKKGQLGLESAYFAATRNDNFKSEWEVEGE